jgi:hypothetical protein
MSRDTSVRDALSTGRIIQGTHHPTDVSSSGHIIPRDASSYGRIIQRTHHPRDVSSKERIIHEHSFGDTLSWHHIFYLGIIFSQINKMYKYISSRTYFVFHLIKEVLLINKKRSFFLINVKMKIYLFWTTISYFKEVLRKREM